jgi:hypothetical protein
VCINNANFRLEAHIDLRVSPYGIASCSAKPVMARLVAAYAGFLLDNIRWPKA